MDGSHCEGRMWWIMGKKNCNWRIFEIIQDRFIMCVGVFGREMIIDACVEVSFGLYLCEYLTNLLLAKLCWL